MTKRMVFGFGMALLALTVWAGMAQAATITVPNGDFEDYASIGDGTTGAGWASFPSSAGGSIVAALSIDDEFWSNPSSFGSGWTSTGPQPSAGKYGLQHPKKSSQQDMTAPFNGDFVGFINLTEGDATGASAGAAESGVLGQLAAGDYTLKVAVGARPSSSWNDVKYTISLISGGSDLGSPVSATLVPATAVLGSNTQDLTYNLSLSSGDALIGQDYAVRIAVENTGQKDGVDTGLDTFTQANLTTFA
jgi:HpiC1 cyclase